MSSVDRNLKGLLLMKELFKLFYIEELLQVSCLYKRRASFLSREELLKIFYQEQIYKNDISIEVLLKYSRE